VLPVDTDVAQVWGQLRAPRPEHALDKFIAATALIHDLTLVTRNEEDFRGTRRNAAESVHLVRKGKGPA